MGGIATWKIVRERGLSGLAAVLCAGLAWQSPAAADKPTGTWMGEAEVRATLVDQPVAGTLPDGTPWTELMKEIGAIGLTSYVEGNRSLRGNWAFDRHGQLCFRYGDGGGGCFRYLRLSANCYEHFFGAGDQPIRSAGPTVGMSSNGPLWRTKEPSTCDAKPSS